VWNVELRLVAHLYAGYALDVLEHTRATDEWKLGGFLIGSPTRQLPINRTTEQLRQTANGIWPLQNEIVLVPNRAQVFFDFLIGWTFDKICIKRGTVYKWITSKNHTFSLVDFAALCSMN
jgi:hypothetical protein